MMAAAVLAVVVLGLGRTSSTAKTEKQRRAAATMQAAARGFFARRLYCAMLMSVATQIIQDPAVRERHAGSAQGCRAARLSSTHGGATFLTAQPVKCRQPCVATSYDTEHLLPHPRVGH